MAGGAQLSAPDRGRDGGADRGAHAPRAGGGRRPCGGSSGDGGSRGLLLPGYVARRSAARRRALRDRGLAATPRGRGDGTAGDQPQPRVPATDADRISGGQTQPRRSAAKKRLTMRSSSEW
jgi:hypothetical protein